ncbi:MAG: maltose alpha-D-glucosyltransferase [Chitinivibrionales bacterium]|nr:maltose alpha-D-glucosyltransferase [Chitinivibrionales bacterium]
MSPQSLSPDPLWYKDAIIYELHVRAFFDSNGDGIGDFNGLRRKLDYLDQLGVTAIWLLPFFPSPLKDDGYDIADYFNINPDYGTLRDFKRFLNEAHKRNIRVIAELVINHTSSEHKWFQRARFAAKGSKFKDYYVWSDTPEKYKDARIIFQDFESSNWSWDQEAQAYYWHRFYAHQPDLNFDNPTVQKEVLKVLDFWFTLGVDAVRLDAIPYLYERDGTSCENLDETHDFLKTLRNHVDAHFSNRMLLAEANQWPEDVLAYFGDGDECHMAFHFPLMPRLFMAVHMEDSYPIIDILRATPEIPETCQWAMFLRNHDELTLEMVTDEERDYMNKVYAGDPRMKINVGIRRRLAPLMENNRSKIELLKVLLFSFPGTPVIYYGDEIGMGDNYYLGDRDGVRTPMQWNADRNAGFSQANPHKLYLPVIIEPQYHFESINIENQDANVSSLLWYMKRLIAMRKKFKAFSRGDIEVLSTDNEKILAFMRRYEGEHILVVANLSRFTQVASIDMPDYAGRIPEEVFGKNEFPAITHAPYTLMLTPYGCYWLLLKQQNVGAGVSYEQPVISSRKSFPDLFTGAAGRELAESVFPAYLKACTWLRLGNRKIRSVSIEDVIPLSRQHVTSCLLILEIGFNDSKFEYVLLPVAFVSGAIGEKRLDQTPQGLIAELHIPNQKGFLYDGTEDPDLHVKLLEVILSRKRMNTRKGMLVGVCTARNGKDIKDKVLSLGSQLLHGEKENATIRYADTLFMKLYRRPDEGTNPEPEMLKYFSDCTQFNNAPRYLGTIEYHTRNRRNITIATFQQNVQNAVDAWTFIVDVAARYFERALEQGESFSQTGIVMPSMLEIDPADASEQVTELFDAAFVEMIALLGNITARMHRCLASSRTSEYKPEPFALHYQKSLYQSIQNSTRRTLQYLKRNLNALPQTVRDYAEWALAAENSLNRNLRLLSRAKMDTLKIRIHGDFHLGQILYTGNDFLVIGWEGNSERPISERKLKYSPFKDVASIIRSLHYAAYSALLARNEFRPEDLSMLESWAQPWFNFISGTFLSAYLKETKQASFMPSSPEYFKTLLASYMLERTMLELRRELEKRPAWAVIPLRGMMVALSMFDSKSS